MSSETNVSNKPSVLLQILMHCFFPAALLFHELLLHMTIYAEHLFSPRLLMIVLSSLAVGLLLNAIIALLPNRKGSRIVFGCLIFLWCVFTGTEFCLKQIFGTYFGVGFAVRMVPSILTTYQSTIGDAFSSYTIYIVLTALPFLLYLLISKKLFSALHTTGKKGILTILLAAGIFQAVTVFLCCSGSNAGIYLSDFTTDQAISKFGLCNDAQLEFTYGIFGVPKETFSFSEFTLEREPETVYNVTDVDFAAMAEKESDSTLKNMDEYFASVAPTAQNEYTGLFKGKNLILITAESLSPSAIDKKLTPALYQLTHEGFTFSDFYQPCWAQSTTGGEFSIMTGLIPTRINETSTFATAVSRNMYYSPGWQFKALGYHTVAYHDGVYQFYDRDKTHPHMGYDFAAQEGSVSVDGQYSDQGLTFSSGFPPDAEMFSQTIPALIKDYKENQTPFHAYYMTVSAHGPYSWEHGSADRNREIIQQNYPNLSETAQAYLACNMDLEYAMEYLLKALSDAEIAQDTVICMAADHYPYFLSNESGDHYNELRGSNDSDEMTDRYRNNLILWCGSMSPTVIQKENEKAEADPKNHKKQEIPEAVNVTVPASAVDILPTLYNLFGIEYDSRLFSGRDLLAADPAPGEAYNGMPVAVIPTTIGRGWKTALGTYEPATGVFTPAKDVTVDQTYIDSVNQIVKAKYNYAQLLIEQDYFSVFQQELNRLQAEKKGNKKKNNKKK